MSGFDDLYWLVEVVDAGTFSAAAEKHNISSAAVSKRIRLMEERLNVKLLMRTTRHLRMTEAGEVFYRQGRHLLQEFEQLENNVSVLNERLCGEIRINAPITFACRELVKPINDFMLLYPELNITLHLDDQSIDIFNSDYDMVIRIDKLEDSSLVAQRLSSAGFYCCASPGYLKAAGEPQIPQDLTQHQCLVYEQSHTYSTWAFTRNGEKERVSVKGRLMANNGDALCHFACNDQGVVYMPEFIVRDFIDRGQLVPILTDYTVDRINVYAMYPTRHYLPLKIKRLIGFLREQLTHGVDAPVS